LQDALELWNTLAGRALIPHSQISSGQPLTNGQFQSEPTGVGFDWHIAKAEGVHIRFTPGELQIGLTGRQPERCQLLSQTLPLENGARHSLRFDYRTSGALATQIAWQVATERSEPLAASAEWLTAQWTFRAGYQRTLALAYQRRPGTTRMEGAVWLRRLSLERL
jgi:hypothetical protein